MKTLFTLQQILHSNIRFEDKIGFIRNFSGLTQDNKIELLEFMKMSLEEDYREALKLVNGNCWFGNYTILSKEERKKLLKSIEEFFKTNQNDI